MAGSESCPVAVLAAAGRPIATLPGPPVARVQRRILAVLVVVQLLGGAGVTTGVAVGVLVAARLSGSEVVGGLALTCSVLGAAVAATVIARVAERAGRRPALLFGYAAGACGALGAVVAVAVESWPLLLAASVPFGAATAANLAARFAATDLAPPHRRARALAVVLWATTVGAVAGPNLAEPAQQWAATAGITAGSGPYVLCAVAFGLAATGTFVGLRPDPLRFARLLASDSPRPVPRSGGLALPARLAVAGIVVAHLVMVGVMSMTPVHLSHGHGGLRVVGIVISVHVAGMYAFSPLFGWLADRLGRFPVLGLGAVLLGVAGIVAGTAGSHDVARLSIGLLALGLGWSATLVAGSALLTDTVAVGERARVQGRADTLMNISGAVGGSVAGLTVASTSYTVLGLAAATLSAALLVTILIAATPTRPTSATRFGTPAGPH